MMVTPALQVCSFESRMSEEMARLIERFGAVATNAPSLREIPLEDNRVVYEFADRLMQGEISVVVFMTGVGTHTLFEILERRQIQDRVRLALEQTLIVARGPKPAGALSKCKVRVDLKAPEPNTWEELALELTRHQVDLGGRRVAVQEYGAPSTAFYRWLSEQGAEVIPVPVYRWGLPENLQPLHKAIQSTLAGEMDVLLWTSAQQVNHVLEVAESAGHRDAWIQAANRCVIGSIGPTASERLREMGLIPDVEPTHPKMAHLVRETLEQAPRVLGEKR